MSDQHTKVEAIEYGARVQGPPSLPSSIALLLTIPMVFVGFLCLPAQLRPSLPFATFRWFWFARAFAMLCALISIFLCCRKGDRREPWFIKLNLLVNLPGLALCTFGILRYVVINMPSHG
jgi:hypothetical protein